MRRLFVVLIFVAISVLSVNSQSLFLEENFDYPADEFLVDHGWTAYSGAGTASITVNNGGLTYSGYPSSGIGNAALLDSDGEDISKTFLTQNSGTLYFTFLLNNISYNSDDYVFLVGDNPMGSTYRGRIFMMNDGVGGDFEIGLSQSSSSPNGVTDNDYSFSTTLLIVMKYVFQPGAADDEVSLFIFESGIPGSEPVTPTLGPFTGSSDVSGIGTLALRQASSDDLIIDGIRVSDSWSQAPLPVELASFNAEFVDNSVQLNWQTATEVNNAGFKVERQNSAPGTQNSDWEVLTFIPGQGTKNSPTSYSFTDNDLPNTDNVSYRLKQIDIDGNYDYSKVVEVDLSAITGVEDEKRYTFALEQNYPNPFNPVTTISYTIPNVVDAKLASGTNAKLIVYNMLGQQVRTLVNEVKPAGNYQVQFDGSNLPSGIYFYTLSYGEFLQTRKLVMLK